MMIFNNPLESIFQEEEEGKCMKKDFNDDFH